MIAKMSPMKVPHYGIKLADEIGYLVRTYWKISSIFKET